MGLIRLLLVLIVVVAAATGGTATAHERPCAGEYFAVAMATDHTTSSTDIQDRAVERSGDRALSCCAVCLVCSSCAVAAKEQGTPIAAQSDGGRLRFMTALALRGVSDWPIEEPPRP